MVSFALLSVRNSPLNNFLLKEFNDLGLNHDFIIFDKKNWSQADVKRFCYRIGKNYSEIEYFKETKNILSFDVENHNNEETKNFIKQNKIDFLVNAGTPRILNNELINASSLGVLNCHPGLLPDFKGCCCVEWSIYLMNLLVIQFIGWIRVSILDL